MVEDDREGGVLVNGGLCCGLVRGGDPVHPMSPLVQGWGLLAGLLPPGARKSVLQWKYTHQPGAPVGGLTRKNSPVIQGFLLSTPFLKTEDFKTMSLPKFVYNGQRANSQSRLSPCAMELFESR